MAQAQQASRPLGRELVGTLEWSENGRAPRFSTQALEEEAEAVQSFHERLRPEEAEEEYQILLRRPVEPPLEEKDPFPKE